MEMENTVAILDDTIPGTSMSYRERIELVAGDKRGESFKQENGLENIAGAEEYAMERAKFWKEWNREWEKKHSQAGMNTQERYLSAQQASPVYAEAVYKTLVSVIASQILRDSAEFQEDLFRYSIQSLQEYLWDFMGGSILMLKKPADAVKAVAREIKKTEYPLGFFFEIKFTSFTDNDVRRWIKQTA